jgi:hypothetical protein
VEKMTLEKYEEVAGFNLEGYYLRSSGGITLSEFMPTREGLEALKENEGYLGVCFIIDNIEQFIWVFQDDTIKTKKVIKSVKNQKKEDKLLEMTIRIFASELNYDVSTYQVRRALDSPPLFNQLLKYQITEYPLYQQHYMLPEYEEESKDKAAAEGARVKATANVKKCANCGWIISKTVEICPKCRRPVEEKFEGKKEE